MRQRLSPLISLFAAIGLASSCSHSDRQNTSLSFAEQYHRDLTHLTSAPISDPTRWVEKKFSDIGYAVKRQEINDYASSLNLIIFKPGLSKNQKSIVITASYPKTDRTNAEGVSFLLDLARRLRDDQLDQNIFFVAYEDEARDKAAVTHALSLENDIGQENMVGLISLNYRTLPVSDSPKNKAYFSVTGNRTDFIDSCLHSFVESWGFPIQKGNAKPIPGYSSLGIPILACIYQSTDNNPDTEKYLASLANMIRRLSKDTLSPSTGN